MLGVKNERGFSTSSCAAALSSCVVCACACAAFSACGVSCRTRGGCGEGTRIIIGAAGGERPCREASERGEMGESRKRDDAEVLGEKPVLEEGGGDNKLGVEEVEEFAAEEAKDAAGKER